MQLKAELPGLKGFSEENIKLMRRFYETWKDIETNSVVGTTEITNFNELSASVNSVVETTELEKHDSDAESIRQLQLTSDGTFPITAFLNISFTHHVTIFRYAKDYDERKYYLQLAYQNRMKADDLEQAIKNRVYDHRDALPNNFIKTIPDKKLAMRTIQMFKDSYLLDYINVEELSIRDKKDIDEKVVENTIIHNVKNFILTFGKDFALIRNQYHLAAFGEDQYIALLFFNRELNCLVAVELKTGKFKTSYLGQLQGYLSVLDGFERKPHENPAIGIILCKDMNKSFVDYVIQDYTKPMGVATYKTSKDMSEELRKALPDVEDLKRLLDSEEEV